jgi:hypothetical protein
VNHSEKTLELAKRDYWHVADLVPSLNFDAFCRSYFHTDRLFRGGAVLLDEVLDPGGIAAALAESYA